MTIVPILPIASAVALPTATAERTAESLQVLDAYSDSASYDVVVYGGSPSGLAAAIQAELSDGWRKNASDTQLPLS